MQETFMKSLKYYRLKRELTQEQLATQIGVSTNTVGRWESGERSPSLKMLHKLAGFFYCDPADLISNPPQPSTSSAEAGERAKPAA